MSTPLKNARTQFFNGQPQAALQQLEADSVSKRNALLAHLDRGLISHTVGDYDNSIDAFKSATALLDELDFISVKEQSSSLLANDWITSYKGEYSERLWIHTFQMMNFLLIGKPEGAAVEARKALEVYAEHGSELKQDWYSRALIAMSFEAAGKPDSAHIEYAKLLEDSLDYPSYTNASGNDYGSEPGIARRAWKNAIRLGRDADAALFKDRISSTNETELKSNQGELILFLQTGAIPRKAAGGIFIQPKQYVSFPIYPQSGQSYLDVMVQHNGAEAKADVVNVQLIDIARKALAGRAKQIGAKSVLRAVVKDKLTDEAYEESELLGGLIGLALYATEVADTRSWETLPAHVSLIQVPLTEGTHSVTFNVDDGYRTYEVVLRDINITSNETTYHSVRVGAGAPRIESDEALPELSQVSQLSNAAIDAQAPPVEPN